MLLSEGGTTFTEILRILYNDKYDIYMFAHTGRYARKIGGTVSTDMLR
jgi:hypothetical protein